MKQKIDQNGINERVDQLIQHLKFSPSMFAKKAEIDNGNFSKKLNGKLPWTIFDIEKICSKFNVPREWLLDGKGEMLDEYKPVTKELPSDMPVRSYDPNVGVPYYNVDFELGFDIMENDQTRNPDYMINFFPYNRCNAWCNARGNSMHPTISGGDIIALKSVEDFRFLISGEIYAIITTNGLRTIKRIKDNGSTLTLIPDNKEYPEQTIEKKEVIRVYQVMGSMKMF